MYEGGLHDFGLLSGGSSSDGMRTSIRRLLLLTLPLWLLLLARFIAIGTAANRRSHRRMLRMACIHRVAGSRRSGRWEDGYGLGGIRDLCVGPRVTCEWTSPQRLLNRCHRWPRSCPPVVAASQMLLCATQIWMHIYLPAARSLRFLVPTDRGDYAMSNYFTEAQCEV